MNVSKVTRAMVPMAMALALASNVALAEHGGPCREDVQRLCPDRAPGRQSFRDCLDQHKDELSSACQTRLTRKAAKIAAWRQACQSDVQAFCGDASGRREVGQCLHEHHDQLSQSCQDVLAKHHRHHGCHHRHAPTPADDSTTS